MKSKDLKPVFTWEERRVLIQDRVWYFPDYHEDPSFVFPGWESSELFGNNHPIHVEYCSGNGAWIVQKAKQYPEINWVGVEIQFKRVRKIWSKLKNMNLSNLVIVCGEGNRWTKTYVPSGSITKTYVNFPDPWPKERHAKNRIINPMFAAEIGRILKPSGEMMMVTDDAVYSDAMVEVFNNKPFKSKHASPHYITHFDGYGSSYFDELWRDKGREIRYHEFVKENHEDCCKT
jgi:tRNA (guanine-N7-)-methyltransferase